MFWSDGLPAEIDQIKYLIQFFFMSLYLFASLPVVVVLYLLMATSAAYLSVLLQWSNYSLDRRPMKSSRMSELVHSKTRGKQRQELF